MNDAEVERVKFANEKLSSKKAQKEGLMSKV